MKNKDYIVFVVSIVIIGLLVTTWLSRPKLAFIDSYEVLENFEGLKEAQSIYELKLKQWHQKSDSLQFFIEQDIKLLTNVSAGLSQTQSNLISNRLHQNQREVQGIDKKIEEFIANEGRSLSDGLLSQVNTFIQEFGTKYNYDLILSNTESGNVLFRKPSLDKTDQVIEELNKAYFDNE